MSTHTEVICISCRKAFYCGEGSSRNHDYRTNRFCSEEHEGHNTLVISTDSHPLSEEESFNERGDLLGFNGWGKPPKVLAEGYLSYERIDVSQRNGMSRKSITDEMKAKYPGCPISLLPKEDPVEIICEIERTETSSRIIGAIEYSAKRFHTQTKLTITILRGSLYVGTIINGEETRRELDEGESITIEPNTMYWACGLDTWVQIDANPPWRPTDQHVVD